MRPINKLRCILAVFAVAQLGMISSIPVAYLATNLWVGPVCFVACGTALLGACAWYARVFYRNLDDPEIQEILRRERDG